MPLEAPAGFGISELADGPAGKCSLARFHIPGQPLPDAHHVIPQAWQRFYRPTVRPVVSNWALGLWHIETVLVCPNHHRLVHEALVALMRGSPGIEVPGDAVSRVFGPLHLTRVRLVALDALSLWVQAGGSLQALRDAGLWGEQ